MPKMTIPAPNTLHFRQGRSSISKEVYPDLEPFFEDRRQGLPQGGARFLRCRLPLSAVRRHHLGDDVRSERELAHSRERGDEPEKLPERYARMINAALEGKPPT